MSKLGIRWTIGGVPAAYVTRGAANGCYRITFEREETDLAAIESIDWSKPEVTAVGENSGMGLPEGYGFELVELTYQHSTGRFVAEVKTAAQYLGDVSGYQADIQALMAQAAEKDAAIAAQKTAAEAVQQQLQAAYEEGVESHG